MVFPSTTTYRHYKLICLLWFNLFPLYVTIIPASFVNARTGVLLLHHHENTTHDLRWTRDSVENHFIKHKYFSTYYTRYRKNDYYNCWMRKSPRYKHKDKSLFEFNGAFTRTNPLCRPLLVVRRDQNWTNPPSICCASRKGRIWRFSLFIVNPMANFFYKIISVVSTFNLIKLSCAICLSE